ncbi:GNAT family N-acetyltransferase [Nocardioides sp. Bht2]|uniref:GNAT family N-acetyltransferase n=1 Tax=Nocardioides sp. Bht2 TaxID=3392297 RepID=UPI0039B6DD81
MSAVIALREATVADAVGLAALDATGFEADRWDAAGWENEITGANRRIVVAHTETASDRADEQIVAVIATMVLGDVADLIRIVVDPRFRRGGVARRLVLEALAAARGDGAERMLLEVSSDNHGAVAFYQTLGFTQIDLRPRYYRDGSDALILMRAAAPSSEGSAG